METPEKLPIVSKSTIYQVPCKGLKTISSPLTGGRLLSRMVSEGSPGYGSGSGYGAVSLILKELLLISASNWKDRLYLMLRLAVVSMALT